MGRQLNAAKPDIAMLKYFLLIHRNLPECLLAGLVLVLALSYGAFAMVAFHNARNGGAEFFVTANPWEPASQSQNQPAADHRLAFRVPSSGTP